MKKFLTYILPLSLVAFLGSCRYTDTTTPGYEYMPDMYRSPSYETYSSNPNFPDSITSRQPVAGTIARGDAIFTDMDRMPYVYPNTVDGYEQAGRELKSPLPETAENLAEGKRLFFNYCQSCHGETGLGDGPVTKRNGPIPPAYSSDLLKNLPEGKMFHTLQFGKNMMGSHASQLTPTQRWKIIQHVKTLQHIAPPMAAGTATDSSAAATPKM